MDCGLLNNVIVGQYFFRNRRPSIREQIRETAKPLCIQSQIDQMAACPSIPFGQGLGHQRCPRTTSTAPRLFQTKLTPRTFRGGNIKGGEGRSRPGAGGAVFDDAGGSSVGRLLTPLSRPRSQAERRLSGRQFRTLRRRLYSVERLFKTSFRLHAPRNSPRVGLKRSGYVSHYSTSAWLGRLEKSARPMAVQ